MAFSTRFLFGSVVAALVLSGSHPAWAQLAQPKPSPVEAEGTIDAISAFPPAVKISTSTNQTWVFRLAQKAEIRVTGTAEADFLHPRLFIEFTTDLDARGNAPNKVAELGIFSPTMQKFPGLFPAGGGFGEKPDPAAKKDPRATSSYKVLGQITAIKNDKITVNTGRGTVKIELAESPKITVDIADISAAQQGDKIKLRGSSAQEGFGEASQVEIEMAQPLSAKKKTPRKPEDKPDNGKEKPVKEKPEKKEPKKTKKGKQEPKEDDPKEEPAPDEKPKEDAAAGRAPQVSERVRQIVSLLELKPEEAQGRRPTKIALGADAAEVFAPARPEPLAKIEGLLGKPQATRTIEGMMAPNDADEPKFVSLRLLVCDGVKVFVDEQGVVRFYQVSP